MDHRPFLLLAITAALQADPGDALLSRTYAKLAASFSASATFGQGQVHLLLASPGIPLSAEDCKDAYAISLLADAIPAPGMLYQTAKTSCATTYGTILAQAQASNFVDQAKREKARKARRALYDKSRPGQPTQAYALYLKHQAIHAAAEDSLNLALTERQATGRPVPPGLDKAVQDALKAWTEVGGRDAIEDHLKSLDAFYADSPMGLLQQLSDDLNSACRNDGHPEVWYPITAQPPPETFFGDEGWKPFTLGQSERSLPGTLPPAGGGAQVSGVPDEFQATASLRLETKRVTLTRPWMDLGLFRSRRWRLSPDGGFTLVSSGTFDGRDPGIMPMVVTGLLLSRKLVLKGQWRAGSGKAPKALGPFGLAGPGTVVRDGMLTLTAEAPQILGFFCTVIPKSPDPDEKAFRH